MALGDLTKIDFSAVTYPASAGDLPATFLFGNYILIFWNGANYLRLTLDHTTGAVIATDSIVRTFEVNSYVIARKDNYVYRISASKTERLTINPETGIISESNVYTVTIPSFDTNPVPCVIGDYIFIFGGSTGSGNSAVYMSYIYRIDLDPVTKAVNNASLLSETTNGPRLNATFIAIDDAIFIFGGSTGWASSPYRYYGTTEIGRYLINLTTGEINSFSVLSANLPFSFSSGDAIFKAGFIFIFGGANHTNPASPAATNAIIKLGYNSTVQNIESVTTLTIALKSAQNDVGVILKANLIYVLIKSSLLDMFSIESPSIDLTGTDGSLGTFSAIFTPYRYNYFSLYGDSPEFDTLPIKEYLDGYIKKEFMGQINIEYDYDVSGINWTKLPNGTHSIAITVGEDTNKQYRMLSFNKNEDTIQFSKTTPLTSELRPDKMRIQNFGDLPEGSTLSIQVTNNAYDPAPVWEDATSAYNEQQDYEFQNTIKTAEYWGVNLKMTITRGSVPSTTPVMVEDVNFSYD
ncbi:MAG: hypothetical protein LBB22_04220 [Treponema sp.]|jgi:hypothetical protein|nr:hypothetical protein [Treponema sp.]